jgi:hypothetical protein
MLRVLVVALALLFFAFPTVASGQHGTAENGYYPVGYDGDTWTGAVTNVNDEAREITLTYTKGDKTESFQGELEKGYKVKLKDGTMHEMRVSEIPLGTRLKVYYVTRWRKIDGKKTKYNEIFRLQSAEPGSR